MAFEGTEGRLPAYEGKSEIYKLKNRPQYFDKNKDISEEWSIATLMISLIVSYIWKKINILLSMQLWKWHNCIVFWSSISECKNMIRQMWINAVWKVLISALY